MLNWQNIKPEYDWSEWLEMFKQFNQDYSLDY